jgi:hypothetical protein
MKRGVHSKLFCRLGHSLLGDDVYVSANGNRACRQCTLDRSTTRYNCLTPFEKDRLLRRQRMLNTGRSPAEYAAAYESQGGVCAICGKSEPRGVLHSDHNHATGQRRGFLCQGCNQGLGNFLDSPESLRNAALYIEYWRMRDGRTVGDMVPEAPTGQRLSA